MKGLLFLLVLLLGACATHAPMSEMVMFNNQSADNGKQIKGGIAVTYLGNDIPNETFQKKQEGDYYERDEFGFTEFISAHYYRMNEDIFGYSFSVGEGFGLDVTKKIKNDYYGTALLSANQSAKLILQRRFFDNMRGGFAPGVFLSMENRGYDDFCLDDPCYKGFVPDNQTKLYSAGLRGRFLIRELRKPGIALTGLIEIGHIFEVKESFVGLNFSITAF